MRVQDTPLVRAAAMASTCLLALNGLRSPLPGMSGRRGLFHDAISEHCAGADTGWVDSAWGFKSKARAARSRTTHWRLAL